MNLGTSRGRADEPRNRCAAHGRAATVVGDRGGLERRSGAAVHPGTGALAGLGRHRRHDQLLCLPRPAAWQGGARASPWWTSPCPVVSASIHLCTSASIDDPSSSHHGSPGEARGASCPGLTVFHPLGPSCTPSWAVQRVAIEIFPMKGQMFLGSCPVTARAHPPLMKGPLFLSSCPATASCPPRDGVLPSP